eukprot:5230301-Amphidinium_carterae.1
MVLGQRQSLPGRRFESDEVSKVVLLGSDLVNMGKDAQIRNDCLRVLSQPFHYDIVTKLNWFVLPRGTTLLVAARGQPRESAQQQCDISLACKELSGRWINNNIPIVFQILPNWQCNSHTPNTLPLRDGGERRSRGRGLERTLLKPDPTCLSSRIALIGPSTTRDGKHCCSRTQLIRTVNISKHSYNTCYDTHSLLQAARRWLLACKDVLWAWLSQVFLTRSLSIFSLDFKRTICNPPGFWPNTIARVLRRLSSTTIAGVGRDFAAASQGDHGRLNLSVGS